MDELLFKVGGWLLLAILALFACALALDSGFSVHMAIASATQREICSGRTKGRAPSCTATVVASGLIA